MIEGFAIKRERELFRRIREMETAYITRNFKSPHTVIIGNAWLSADERKIPASVYGMTVVVDSLNMTRIEVIG